MGEGLTVSVAVVEGSPVKPEVTVYHAESGGVAYSLDHGLVRGESRAVAELGKLEQEHTAAKAVYGRH